MLKFCSKRAKVLKITPSGNVELCSKIELMLFSLELDEPRYLISDQHKISGLIQFWVQTCAKSGPAQPEGGGGGGTPKILGTGVRPASQNLYPVYDQDLRFFPKLFMTKTAIFPPYFGPDQKFDTLFMTWYPTSYQKG